MEQHDILLIAPVGPLREALASLIGKLPQVNRLVPVNSSLLALKVFRQINPPLIVFASSIPEEEMIELVRQVKQIAPAAQCVAMVETRQQGERARAVGAITCLFANTSAAELLATIQQALNVFPSEPSPGRYPSPEAKP